MLSEVEQEGLKHGAHSPPNSVQCLNFCDEWAISLNVTWIICAAFLILMHALCTLKCSLINYMHTHQRQSRTNFWINLYHFWG